MTFDSFTYEHQSMIQLENNSINHSIINTINGTTAMSGGMSSTINGTTAMSGGMCCTINGTTAMSGGMSSTINGITAMSGTTATNTMNTTINGGMNGNDSTSIHDTTADDDSSINIAAQMALEAIKEGLSDQISNNLTMITTANNSNNNNLNFENNSNNTSTMGMIAVAAESHIDHHHLDPLTPPFIQNEFHTFLELEESSKKPDSASSGPLISKEQEIIYNFVDGRYECPRAGCGKLYKNKNGLKYHLQKGLCNGSFDVVGADGKLIDQALPTPDQSNSNSPRQTKATRLQAADFANDPEAYARYKPFWCRMCSKRYKNINGLRYHAKAEHGEFAFDDIKGQVLGI